MACRSVWSRSVITEPTTRPDQTAGVLLTTSIRGPTRWISSVTSAFAEHAVDQGFRQLQLADRLADHSQVQPEQFAPSSLTSWTRPAGSSSTRPSRTAWSTAS